MAENVKTGAVAEQFPKLPEATSVHPGDVREPASRPSDSIEDRKLAPPTIRRSRGYTPAGKLASSRNSLRSGIFARAIVLEGESPREFNSLLEDLRKSIGQDSEIERYLTERLATILWRQARLLRAERAEIAKALDFHETNRFANPHDLGDPSIEHCEGHPTRSDHFARDEALQCLRKETVLVPALDAVVRLTGYERHLGRELDRVLSQLERIRALRKQEPGSSSTQVDVTSNV